MTDIKMFPMGFGESIMLSNENECMLVDCGSESEYKNTYFNNVFNELDRYGKKSAMISHFHEDHIKKTDTDLRLYIYRMYSLFRTRILLIWRL